MSDILKYIRALLLNSKKKQPYSLLVEIEKVAFYR
jgi:hypothetical protein